MLLSSQVTSWIGCSERKDNSGKDQHRSYTKYRGIAAHLLGVDESPGAKHHSRFAQLRSSVATHWNTSTHQAGVTWTGQVAPRTGATLAPIWRSLDWRMAQRPCTGRPPCAIGGIDQVIHDEVTLKGRKNYAIHAKKKGFALSMHSPLMNIYCP